VIRVGILNDMSDGPPGPSDLKPWLLFAIGELTDLGRLDGDIELVDAWGLGLPAGTADAVVHAYEKLVDDEAVMIVGPAIGDNALIATPLAERHRVPTINWAGSERARSEYMFHLQVGSHEDESIVLARHVASTGATRIGVVYDESPIGQRYLNFLRAESAVLGLSVTAAEAVSPLADEAAAAVEQVVGTGPEAFLYLGLGLCAAAVADALVEGGWEGPRALNTAGMRGYQPEIGRALEGWVYVDMYSDQNPTLADVCRRRKLSGLELLGAPRGYDLGRLVAEGLARATELTRDGVKQGLELVKWLPAAQGHDGTLLGFGNHDRGALHGRFLVLRQWSKGRSIEVEVDDGFSR
jgi:ABC-type branched-subunit amino acid transport system substrate-binding protein